MNRELKDHEKWVDPKYGKCPDCGGRLISVYDVAVECEYVESKNCDYILASG